MPPAHNLPNVRRLAADGYTMPEIADKLGLPRSTVRSICRRHKIETAQWKPTVSDKTQRIMKLYAAGSTFIEIANKVGVTRKSAWVTVKRRLHGRPSRREAVK